MKDDKKRKPPEPVKVTQLTLEEVRQLVEAMGEVKSVAKKSLNRTEKWWK